MPNRVNKWMLLGGAGLAATGAAAYYFLDGERWKAASRSVFQEGGTFRRTGNERRY
jgi:hypothetical protein